MSETGDDHRLSVLAAAMSRYPPTRNAWRDFVADYRSRLKVISLKAEGAYVEVPLDMWDHWSSVAAGENAGYDAAGARRRNKSAASRKPSRTNSIKEPRDFRQRGQWARVELGGTNRAL